MSDDIVETIDNALDDWTVSGDAVRWTPEKAPERGDDLTRRRNRGLRALLLGAGIPPTAHNIASIGAAYDALRAPEPTDETT